MKSIILVTIIYSLVIPFLYSDIAYVRDYKWDDKNNRLEYTLTGDAVIKIRVGAKSGPIYQTIVNLEKRLTGPNREFWNKSEFINFSPYHFCIDTQPKIIQDSELLLTAVINDKTLSLTIDIEPLIKGEFLKEPSEIRIFIDNKLNIQAEPKVFPYITELSLVNLKPGRHLLTVNCFQKIRGGACAYKSTMIDMPEEAPIKSNTPSLLYSTYINGFWQIAMFNLHDSSQTPLTTTPIDKSHPVIPPDGSRLAYVTNTGELWIMDMRTKESTKIPLPIHCTEPKWSPDGTRIVFTSYSDLYHSNTELWLLEIKTNKLTKLTNRPWLQYQPEWSPDGKEIIFIDGPELYGQEIRKLNIETGDITLLTEDGPYDYDLYPAYHPKGEKIYYCSNKTGDYDIWVMDRYGQNPINLTNHPGHDIMPVPIGKYIYFISDRDGATDIFRIRLDGRRITKITNNIGNIKDISIFP